MDDFMSSHPEFIPLFFVVMFVAVNGILGALSGWFALMERYPARDEAPLLTLRSQSGSMNLVSINGLLTLSVCPSGLRVGMGKVFGIRLIGLFQRDFLVPWHELSVVRKKRFLLKRARLEFGKPALGNLTVAADVADRLARAAGEKWPETAIPPRQDRAQIAKELFKQWLIATAAAALFFTVASRLGTARGGGLPVAIAILFPALGFGVFTLLEFFRRTRN